MKLLSFIIPTYTNVRGLLNLLVQLSDYEGDIIVVDNKPDEAKSEKLKAQKVIYLPQEKNLGFAAGVNEGAKHAASEWLAILNDDIVFRDPSASLGMTGGSILSKLVEYARENKLDAVSPVLKKPDGSVENYGYTVLPIGKVKLNFIDPVSEHGMTQEKDPSANRLRMTQNALDSSYLDGITAACLLIKKSVFDEMKGFDESFFAYLEDVDLFLRIKKAGYCFGICPHITVIHNHMGTSSKMGWFKEKQDFINWFRVIGKNWETKKIIMNLPEILVERGRNLSGLVKKIIKVIFNF